MKKYIFILLSSLLSLNSYSQYVRYAMDSQTMAEKDSIEKLMVGTWTLNRTLKNKDKELWTITIYPSCYVNIVIKKTFNGPVKGPNWSYDRRWWNVKFTATYINDMRSDLDIRKNNGYWWINELFNSRNLVPKDLVIKTPNMNNLKTNVADRVRTVAKAYAYSSENLPICLFKNSKIKNITSSQIIFERLNGEIFILQKAEK